MDKDLLALVLKNTKEQSVLNLSELEKASTKKKIDQFIQDLGSMGIFFQPTIDGNLLVEREERTLMVLYGAMNGIDFENIIKHLTWQEFELLTTKVGDEFGYFASTGLNFSTAERKYQIDVILRNRPYILLIDCKHFGGTGKQSALREAPLEQIARVKAVAQEFPKLKVKLQVRSWKQVMLLPIIITWLDDAVFFHEKVPIVPFSKLRSFFQNFHLYLEDIYKLSVEE